MTRHVELIEGQVYENKGGGKFLCLRKINEGTYQMMNIKSSWILQAHEITMYEDGSIEWDYSTDGHFE